jgi:hypothetical protein
VFCVTTSYLLALFSRTWRVRLFLVGGLSFMLAGAAQYAAQRVVRFVAGVSNIRSSVAGHDVFAGPRPRPRRRVLNRESVFRLLASTRVKRSTTCRFSVDPRYWSRR